MTNATSKAINEAAAPFITSHRDAYLRSGGVEGHIMDIRDAGGHGFTTHLLLKTTGRKSGKTRFTPLTYGDIGGEVVIIASRAGADRHPDWYINLRDKPDVEFQIGTQAFRATWREPGEAEREKIWSFMEQILPVYASYKAATDRRIPVILMKATTPIPVFRPEELDS
jgi:deazaflavin-dependent oxidoreductase (nitroreductase family)